MRFVRTAENLFGLPSGFQRTEYLQSSGTQYIDTGYKPNSNTKVEAKFKMNSTPARFTWLFLARNENVAGGGFGFGCIANGSIASEYNNRQTSSSRLTSGITYTITKDKNVCKFNNETLTNPTSTFTVDYTLPIFTLNNVGEFKTDTIPDANCYYFRIYDNDVLVRDFIPCIDPLGVACMYDLVGKKPYYNQGTGTFTTGRQIIPVEYLEGTGTQYINTGITGFADFELGIKIRENVSNVAVFCGNNYRMERINASNPYWRFRNNNDFYPTEVPITEYHVMAWKNDKVYADGVKLQDFAKTWNVSANMTLFGSSGSGSYPNMIYFCKLWNPTDGSLLRDFIPCKDENDNGFLFDKVSGVCYLNNGTGAFSVGEPVYTSKLRLIKDARIPDGYTRVEYLESTGEQYIDTGILPSEDLRTKVVQEYTGTTIAKNSSILGSNGNGNLRYWINYDNHFEIGYGNYLATSVVVQPNELNTIDFNYIKNGSHYFTINGTEYSTSGTPNTQYSIVLFGRVVLTQTPVLAPQRIYSVQFIRNGVLIGDFIPVRDSNNVGYMFDEVTGQIFGNAGSGSFGIGNDLPTAKVRFIQDVLPREYRPLKYLQSTGTQYILTGFTPTVNTDFEIELSSTDTLTRWAMGCPTWVGVHYKGTEVGITNSSSAAYQKYTSYNHDNSKLTMKLVGSTVYANGVSLGTITRRAGTLDFALFGYRDANNGATLFFVGNIYKCIIWDNGVPVRDLYPALRKSDNKPGMYDRITKQFFTNQGTGEFNYGV